MNLHKILDKTIEYGFYALFFFTPLLFNPIRQFPSYELFEWNKMMFVYFLTTIIICAWIGKTILARKLLFIKTPFTIPLLLFVGSQCLATIFSIDRHVSIFGYYSRFHGGLLSTISYTLLFLAFTTNMGNSQVKRLFTFALISGFIVAGYGILEKFGIDKDIWIQDVQSRVFSTLGQPNWLAAFLAILLPVAIYNLLIIRMHKLAEIKIPNFWGNIPKNHRINRFLNFVQSSSILHFTLCTLFYLCLLFTKSRSGFLGFWAANGIFWATLWWKAKDKIYLKKPFLILNLAFVILNFFFTTPFGQYNKYLSIELLQKNAPQKIEKTTVTDSVLEVGAGTDSGDLRKIVWKGAFDIIKNYPMFGTGPETFAYAYYRFRPVEHNLTSEWDFLYNRAHNEFLNIAATSGLTGLITYLMFILTFCIFAVKQAWHKHDIQLKIISAALLSAFAGILVTNFFGFSVVIVGLYFYLIPAFLYCFNVDAQQDNNSTPPSGTQIAVAFAASAIPAVTITLLLAMVWLTDSMYAKAIGFRRSEDFAQAYPLITAAVSMRPDEPMYHDERASIAAGLALGIYENKDATSASQLMQEALAQSKQAITISPQNVNFWKTRTKILFQFSTIDEQFADKALTAISIAQELAPTDAKIAYNRAVILNGIGKQNEAIDQIKKTLEMKSDYKDAYIALSIFYEKANQIESAKEAIRTALKKVNPNDGELKERLEKLK